MLFVTLKKNLQKILMVCYRCTVACGFFKSSLGAALYRRTYFLYKKHIEAGAVKNLRQFVTPGSWIIDVGANIGFFSVYFCQWVSEGGKVIALEPEPHNYSQLLVTLKRENQEGKIETHSVAVDCQKGTVRLALNPAHPGDHKLGTEGIKVSAVSIDSLLADRNWPDVSLIKIDVQGAEMRVLQGARKTIERAHPAFFVEIDESALHQFDASAKDIFMFFSQFGYNAYMLGEKSIPAAVSYENVSLYLREHQYTDLLFLVEQH